MTRKELLIEEIQKELVRMDLEELDICSNDENQMDKDFPYDNISKLIGNVSSDICIERVESETDSRYQVTAFIMVDPIKGYTVILDSSFEDTFIECVGDLADTIIEYEDLANTLVLKKTIELDDNLLKKLLLEEFDTEDLSKITEDFYISDVIQAWYTIINQMGFSFEIMELGELGIKVFKKASTGKYVELDNFKLNYNSYEELKSTLINLELKAKNII